MADKPECHYQGFWYMYILSLSLCSIEWELLFSDNWESLGENLQVKDAILDRLGHVFSSSWWVAKCTLASI